MNWTDALDIYCERTSPAFWAEPVNALTNLAFVLAAAALWRRTAGQRDLRALVVLLGLIGVGSFVFHTVAQRWASVLDVVFIALFVVVFIQRAQVRLLGQPEARASALTLGVLAVSAALAASVKWPLLNGSELYLGPWLALIGLAWACPPGAPRKWLGASAALFALSVCFRSADLALCEAFPLGTHFGWHLNNALVLWCALRALLAHSDA